MSATPTCAPGCGGDTCHCQACGESGVELSPGGYCAGCAPASDPDRDDHGGAAFPGRFDHLK